MSGLESGFRLPRHVDYVILDAPAGIRGAELTALVRRAQTILIPVLPSATDMRATARFVRDLLLVGKVSRKETRLATIANRVPETPALARAAEILLNGIDSPVQSVPSQSTVPRTLSHAPQDSIRRHAPGLAQLCARRRARARHLRTGRAPSGLGFRALATADRLAQ
jgi:cellulose biosynthesis protein BcsQ